MARLNGKRILVTAAARGIGRATALACAAEGADVLASDIDGEKLSELDGACIELAAFDCTDAAAVDRACAGRAFDAVIHCVGYVHQGSVLDCNADAWRHSFAVNVDSFYNVVRAVLPTMLADGGGSIVCISSVASSIMGVPKRAAYGATKAAMIGLVKSIAADYADQHIRCNAVCPGTIETPSLQQRMEHVARDVGGLDQARAQFVSRQPMGRLGTAEEVAALCVYLASDESRFVTSQLISIDGGMSM